MKIRYIIFKADELIKEHLRRSIDFDNVDLLFMARKSLENLEHSRMSHLLIGDIKMITDSMKDRSKAVLDNINELFKVDIENNAHNEVLLTLYISNDYFITGDSIEAKFGRLGKRLVHFMSRQGIIDGIEKNLRQTYDLKFVWEIIESDGKNLRIGSNQ